MKTNKEETKANTLLKEIPIKGCDYDILIYGDGFITLPSSEIDIKMAIDYIDSIQKAIEFLRESETKEINEN